MSKPVAKSAAAKKATSTGPSYEVSIRNGFLFRHCYLASVDKANEMVNIGAKRSAKTFIQTAQWMDDSMLTTHTKLFGSNSHIRFTPSPFVRFKFARAFGLTRRDWSAWMVCTLACLSFLHG
jgi:hypothetical protein